MLDDLLAYVADRRGDPNVVLVLDERGHALIDRMLYLPRLWTDDRARCAVAPVPEEVGFATKPALGLTMLEGTRAARQLFAWIAGDSVNGADRDVQCWAQARGIGYALAVAKGQRLAMCPVAAWMAFTSLL